MSIPPSPPSTLFDEPPMVDSYSYRNDTIGTFCINCLPAKLYAEVLYNGNSYCLNCFDQVRHQSPALHSFIITKKDLKPSSKPTLDNPR